MAALETVRRDCGSRGLDDELPSQCEGGGVGAVLRAMVLRAAAACSRRPALDQGRLRVASRVHRLEPLPEKLILGQTCMGFGA